MQGKIVGNILRFLFAWIDGVVAKVITEVYKLLINLSSIILYSNEIVSVVGRRVGLILGIFMLFRLAISLISYMISPDKTKDGSTGGGKLVTNIVISLVLLATINNIFEYAYKVQMKIIDSRIIEKIFFGENKSYTDMDIGYYLYSGFFTPNSEVFTQNECDSIWDLSKPFTGSSCETKLTNDLKLDGDALDAIVLTRNKMQMKNVFLKYKLVLAMDDTKDEFVFNYTPILSTAAGVITLLVLISFSMELATRAVRLLFLQIIAPIPIIFNMDLGKGKDVFQKWYKDCFSTYISVFLRLLAINFVVFMIVLLNGHYKEIFTGNWLLNVFLIIGCLIFAKRVPKLLEDMLGIKMDGMSLKPLKKFQEQALFGKQITGLAGAGLATGAAVGSNMANQLYSAARNFGKGNFKDGFVNLGKTPFSAFAGGMSAAGRGALGALKGQSFSQVYKGAYGGAMTARVNRADREELGIKPWEVWGENIKSSMHIANENVREESKLKHYGDYSSAGSAAKKQAESEVDKKAEKIKINGESLGVKRDRYERLKNNGPVRSDSVEAVRRQLMSSNARNVNESDSQYNDRINALLAQNESMIEAHFNAAQKAHDEATASAHADYMGSRKSVVNAYIDNSSKLHGDDGSGKFTYTKRNADGTTTTTTIEGFTAAFDESDDIVTSNVGKMRDTNENYGLGIDLDTSPNAGISKAIDAADFASSNIRNSGDYERRQLIKQQAQKEKK